MDGGAIPLQAVILAGGLGTRLRPITHTIPKAMVPVCGRPFMEYQLEALCASGVDDVVLCVGYLGQQIVDHFGDGRKFGLSIRYGFEREQLLGTAGAIKNVQDLLNDSFFVVNGDTYPMVDFSGIMRYFLRQDRLGLMVVFRNADQWDRSNAVVEGGTVRVYEKNRKLPGMVYIDFGVSAFRREVLGWIPAGEFVDLASVYQPLIERGQLLAYEAPHRFYEVGSRDGLHEFNDLVQSGVIRAPSTKLS